VQTQKIGGVGLVSNLQFFISEDEMHQHLRRPLAPPDETHFVFDLESGSAYATQSLGLFAEDFLIIRPWLDRWGREQNPLEGGSMYEEEAEALAAFDNELKRIGGSAGISSGALFNTRDGTLLWLYLSTFPPAGVIFNRRLSEHRLALPHRTLPPPR
jgi:hypothetical protein